MSWGALLGAPFAYTRFGRTNDVGLSPDLDDSLGPRDGGQRMTCGVLEGSENEAANELWEFPFRWIGKYGMQARAVKR